MLLDIQTLYIIASLVAIMLGALLIFFWRQEKIATLGWWGAAYLIGGLSIAAWTAGGDNLHPLVVLLLHITGFLAFGLVWTAARVFHGRKPLFPEMLSGAVLWAVSALVPAVAQLPALHGLIGMMIVAAFVALTAGELLSERRKAARWRGVAMIVPGLHGLVLMLPIVIGELMLSDGSALDAHSEWIAAFAVQLTLYVIGAVFVVIMLVSERTLSAHKLAASIDPLTALFNRRGLSEATSRLIAREAKVGLPVTVMISDIDHFKSINDRFGHPTGDEILKLFAVTMKGALRMTDLVGRIGGEEFVGVLPCAMDEALIAAERVRSSFAASGIEVDDEPVDTTVSIGVATGRPGTAFDIMLGSADTALYVAKRSGRNRVEAASEELLSLENSRKAEVDTAAPREHRVVSRTAATDAAA